jgi:hypothetical protein
MSASVQSEAETTATASTIELFWVMTVQAPDGVVATRTAVITVPVGFTRKQAYDYVIAQFKERYGSPLTVLFFDLAENEI